MSPPKNNQQQHIGKSYKKNRKSIKEIHSALNIMNGSQITAMDVQQLEINVSDIQQQVNQLEQERDKLLQSVDSKLGFYKKRAEGVAKKKDAAKQRLDGLKEESREMRTEIMLSI